MMSDSNSSSRRKLNHKPSAETLETRSLLTGGAGSIFALISGEVAQAAAPSKVEVTLTAEHFTLPKRSITLGIDVAATEGSTLKPLISAVKDKDGTREQPTIRAFYGAAAGSQAGTMTTATLVNLKAPGGRTPQPLKVATEVTGDANTTGGYLLGFYLPGDADGDGEVSRADLKTIRNLIGTDLDETGYQFDADSNRDGRITNVDLGHAQRNLGVKTTVQPLVMATLDKVSDSGVPDRITTYQDVIFTGTATPGATVTYAEKNGNTPTVTKTVGDDGTYVATVRLGVGVNKFEVTSRDGFGQEISGQIADVSFQPPAVPVASPTTPSEPPKPVVKLPNAQDDSGGGGVKDQATRLRERLQAQRQAQGQG